MEIKRKARIDSKTLEDLEFPSVLRQVAEFCVTEPGKEAVLSITPFQEFDEIEPELQRVKEFTASFDGDNRIPNHGFDPIFRELRLLEIENSSLEISGFRKILSISETTRILLKFFKKFEEFYIHLNSFSEEVNYTSIISEEINKRIDKYGEIKDEASAELGAIRRRLNVVKGKINSSFTKALSQYAQSDYLDEIRESVVENRRVLAVKAMHRKKVKGAVLGSSKTGSIVYIEPQETLEYANELSNLLYEEDEEIKRILKAMTEFVRPHAALLANYQEYLITMDVLYAKAKYGLKINGVLPIIVSEKKISLVKAYHPLLLVSNNKRKEKTFPQSIELVPDKRIIVISGPNAGGKSITLKTVGLLQVMLQSGLLISAEPQSEMCFFKRILTDIGDNQSIENHLSTYSYRLKKMNQFLKKCNNKTLFLIDEFGTGSDPELGGALAETFLEVFYEREAFGIITTHYTNLKLLANELPHAINANMQFDNKSLEPLYQLHLGEAGSSYTFEVAQKNGIPYSLINKAKKKIERGKVRFDKTIANLQKERSNLRKTSESLKSEEQKARLESKQLEEVNARVQEKLESYQELFDANQKLISLGKKVDVLSEKYFNNKQKKQLIDELMKLVMIENSKRKKLAPKVKKAVKAKEREVIKEVEKKVEVIRERKKEEKEKAKKMPPPKPKVALKIGDRVRMIDGRAIGTIDTIEKNKAIVNYGMFTTNVSLEELEKV
ncbi:MULTISPECIES: endonuclease MutS2 [Aequorivita]|uniref:DNA mismatch repair protein MutS n=1 Tax=Aequorivita iocasae TaxID=2803865 RepID=A0ABX7DPZ7_9FLAO|nr:MULTISPECIES: DNA mismatch repair protein MutS [Aequorivita]QQX76215.1 DNA mismatch repair protein MutS [Aequorivita iocasae]UCA55674.1 DNA mismatch repair protein MutS [Aequorivita sp. F7]